MSESVLKLLVDAISAARSKRGAAPKSNLSVADRPRRVFRSDRASSVPESRAFPSYSKNSEQESSVQPSTRSSRSSRYEVHKRIVGQRPGTPWPSTRYTDSSQTEPESRRGILKSSRVSWGGDYYDSDTDSDYDIYSRHLSRDSIKHRYLEPDIEEMDMDRQMMELVQRQWTREVTSRSTLFNVNPLQVEIKMYIDMYILQRELDVKFIATEFGKVFPSVAVHVDKPTAADMTILIQYEKRLNFCEIRDLLQYSLEKRNNNPYDATIQKECTRVILDNLDMERIHQLFTHIVLLKTPKPEALAYMQNYFLSVFRVNYDITFLEGEYQMGLLNFGVLARDAGFVAMAIPGFIPEIWRLWLPRDLYVKRIASIPLAILRDFSIDRGMRGEISFTRDTYYLAYEDFVYANAFTIRAPYDLQSVMLFGGKTIKEKGGPTCAVQNRFGCVATHYEMLNSDEHAYWVTQWSRTFEFILDTRFEYIVQAQNLKEYQETMQMISRFHSGKQVGGRQTIKGPSAHTTLSERQKEIIRQRGRETRKEQERLSQKGKLNIEEEMELKCEEIYVLLKHLKKSNITYWKPELEKFIDTKKLSKDDLRVILEYLDVEISKIYQRPRHELCFLVYKQLKYLIGQRHKHRPGHNLPLSRYVQEAMKGKTFSTRYKSKPDPVTRTKGRGAPKLTSVQVSACLNAIKQKMGDDGLVDVIRFYNNRTRNKPLSENAHKGKNEICAWIKHEGLLDF